MSLGLRVSQGMNWSLSISLGFLPPQESSEAKHLSSVLTESASSSELWKPSRQTLGGSFSRTSSLYQLQSLTLT